MRSLSLQCDFVQCDLVQLQPIWKSTSAYSIETFLSGAIEINDARIDGILRAQLVMGA